MLVLRHHQVMSRPQISLLLRRQQLVCGVACVRAWMRRCVGACMRGCVHSCSSNAWYVEDSANCVCVCVCLCTYARACVCVPPPPPPPLGSDVVPVFLSLTRQLTNVTSDTVYRLGARHESCDEVCGALGPEYSCDVVSTSNVNSAQSLTDALASVGHIVPATASFVTDHCSASGWEGNVPFRDVNIPNTYFYCPDTSKTTCGAKQIYRQRLCGCNTIVTGDTSVASSPPPTSASTLLFALSLSYSLNP